MLVRFHARDDVDEVLYKRRMLKGSQYVIYEDAPLASRILINDLNKSELVNKVWTNNGQVWFKKHNSEQKNKIGIQENMETRIEEAR